MQRKCPEGTTRRYVNGESVRALRETLGIPQAVFATHCQISASYLCRIEKGEKQPTPAVARRIADQLGQGLGAITYVVPVACEQVPA